MSRWRTDLREGDVTPEGLYLRRREFLALGAAGAVGAMIPASNRAADAPKGAALDVAKRADLAAGEKPTPYDAVTSYNNFYELGTDKEDPSRNAASLRPRPWTVRIDGEVKKPQTVDVDALLRW